MKRKHNPNLATWRYGAAGEILRSWVIGLAILGAVALLAGDVLGAGVKGPNEIVIPPNRLAVVPLEIDADESEYTVVGVDCDAFREYDPDPKKLRLRVIGYKDTTAWVVVSSAKGGKLMPMHRVQITIGNGPTPPAPPTPPSPVDPVDPEVATLAASLKAAAAKDLWQPEKLYRLSVAYTATASAARSGPTVSALFATLKSQVATALNKEDVAPSVAAILEAQMNAGLPRQPGTAVDGVAAQKLFTKIANALERAAK